MAMKPLTSEAIALAEKKMDMTLDDIIKMSKKSTSKAKNHRTSNKNQKFVNGNRGAARGNAAKVRQFMDSRASFRQGVLAQRRSNFRGNQFPLATQIAKKAATAPIRGRPVNRNQTANWNKPRVSGPTFKRAVKGIFPGKPLQQRNMSVTNVRAQTLDSLFANMKEQRMRVQPQQQQFNAQRGVGTQQRPQQQQFSAQRGVGTQQRPQQQLFNAQRGVGTQQPPQQQQRRRRPRGGRFGGNFTN